MHKIFFLSQRVTIGSLEHVLPIGLAGLFTFLLIRYANSVSDSKIKQRIFKVLTVFVSLSVLGYHLYQIIFNNYNFRTDLPLYLCSLMALLIPIFSFYRRYWIFEILVFWIIAGTLQGVITPDIAVGFPSLDYFRYWIVHLGLLGVIFYAIFVFNMRPKLRSLFKSFLALQVYVLFMIIINYILGANYFYLNEKPEASTLLDYFGEWPYYILTTQLIIIPLFYIIYLGFRLSPNNRS